MPRKAKLPKPASTGGGGEEDFDVVSELKRLYRMVLEDLERIRMVELESGDIRVNKYLYYDQANRILGQYVLLKYKYAVNVENPWETIIEKLKGDKSGKEKA